MLISWSSLGVLILKFIFSNLSLIYKTVTIDGSSEMEETAKAEGTRAAVETPILLISTNSAFSSSCHTHNFE